MPEKVFDAGAIHLVVIAGARDARKGFEMVGNRKDRASESIIEPFDALPKWSKYVGNL